MAMRWCRMSDPMLLVATLVASCMVLHEGSTASDSGDSPAQNGGDLETWWTMANRVILPQGNMGTFPGCEHLNLMTDNQRRACDGGSDLGVRRMTILARASLATTLECQKQFAAQRWNCPKFASGPLFGRHILHNSTREAAFVHALMAASVAHESAKACSEGRLGRDCNCVTNYHEEDQLRGLVDREQEAARWATADYRWKNCDNNIAYGLRMAKKFQSVEPRPGVWSRQRKLLNLHNEKLGRTIVRKGFERAPVCKCLGFTGSCLTRMCWREVPNFRAVGNALFSLYRSPVETTLNAAGDGLQSVYMATVDAAAGAEQPTVIDGGAGDGVTLPAPSENQLVHGSDEWSYCDANSEFDIAGTRGRICQTGSGESDSCRSMCCYRGYQGQTVTQKARCNCRFVFCCSVKCEECTTEFERNTCN
ncbi:protein Wnt-2-like [Sycon ciliatum]|uniref:protein Wnt-2-like n=1 Tax=Sycon ciliatum TaxID=27933 RepID=UPI0031F6B94C